ncbi:4-hydroxy-3-methylbut-2-enyl diphosphate reductase [Thermodesulfobacterium hydrogeniphilum]|uniref:4-hydroxy-3-methylbut-2-enyl diphosphate reductase n=1 Tax=Thermodesulfobacterium hydrogeniphilum TaxID=161156 RepID=UPI00068EE2E4|nr:4-hydroxy-3-methylbut-2-enyl diphosphate reductase [Thermodesulfobacterium hydrogeniphilum]
MKIRIAKKAGFCMGVRRAVNLVLKALNEGRYPIYTYGPLIHNPQTLELLNILGVKIIKDTKEEFPSGVCILRAHGVPPEEKEELFKKHKIIDGTCPRVLKVQALAKKAVSQGKEVIIIGDKNHAEVKGILGYCKNKGYVVNSIEDVEKLPELKNYVILSQTTQNKKLFKELSEAILDKYPNGQIINTICNATEVRQNEVRTLSQSSDAIIVIGGKFSANTNRLAEIAKKEGKKVYLIEKPEELPWEELKNCKIIGITAGASTPNWLINEVVDFIKSKTSNFYRLLKAFSFLSLLYTLNFLFLWLGFLNFINYPWNFKTFFLTLFVFSFLMFRYNFLNLQNQESFKFYYSVKYLCINKHKTLVKFLIVLSALLTLIGAIGYKPKILGLAIVLFFLDQILFKTSLSFLWEFLFFIGLSLYLYPFWDINFAIFFLQIINILLFLRLYLELVYFQTDGFLPKNFLLFSLSYRESVVYKLMFLTIISGILIIIPVIFYNLSYLLTFLVWILAYLLTIIIKDRPLGQIIYLETLSITLPLVYFIISLIIK